MGGRGSGGRPGMGRKPEEQVTDTEALPPVDPPDWMELDVRKVWDGLELLARQQRTLSADTAERFALLCRAIVMERKMAAKILEDGLTYIAVTVDGAGQERQLLKAHPLCSPQRGMMQRIEAGLTAFRLAPMGKPLAGRAKDKPKSALETLQAQRANLRAV